LKKLRDREKQLLKSNRIFQSRLLAKNGELKRLRSKLSYEVSSKVSQSNQLKAKSEEVESLRYEIDQNKLEIDIQMLHAQELEVQVRDALQENDWLREIADTNVVTFDEESQRYTSDLQQCVYELLNHNVSFGNISPVIESVLSLAKRKPNKLPSKSTINNMNIQRLALSQKHIADQLTSETNLCLLSDETNKFGTKYEGMHVTDSSGNYWVLGIR